MCIFIKNIIYLHPSTLSLLATELPFIPRFLQENCTDSSCSSTKSVSGDASSILVPAIVGCLIFVLIMLGCSCFYVFMRWVNNRSYSRKSTLTKRYTDQEEGNRIVLNDNGEIRIQGVGSSNRSNEPFEYFVVMRPVNGEEGGERTLAKLKKNKVKPFDPFNRPTGPLENCFMEPPKKAQRDGEKEKQQEEGKGNLSVISDVDRIENLAGGGLGGRSNRQRRASYDVPSNREERKSANNMDPWLEETKNSRRMPGPHLLQNENRDSNINRMNTIDGGGNYEVDEMEQILTNERLYNEIFMPNNPPPRNPASALNMHQFLENTSQHGTNSQSHLNSLPRPNPALEMANNARADRKKKKKEKKVNKILEFTEKGKYDENFAEFQEKECAICFEQYERGNDIRKLVKCGHLFHAECIENWISATVSRKKHKNHNIVPTCPLCKIEIK